MRTLPRLGVVPRLTLLSVVTMAIAVAVSVWVSTRITEAEMYRRAQTNLSINLKLLDSILAGYGAPSRKGDQFYFGTTLINGNFEAVDKVKAIAGGTATVFFGDARVSTNVMRPDGTRAVGTRLAAGLAHDAVFGKHQTYSGEAEILGEPYLTIYEPIMSDGAVIGIAYVGVKKVEFFAVLRSLITTTLAASGGVILLAGLVMLWMVRRVFAPISTIRRELVAMAGRTIQQELDARTLAKLNADLEELRRTLYQRGQPRCDGDKLLFGSRAVNSDLALVDTIGAHNGVLVSVFLGDRRVTTNVCKEDGTRVIGSQLDRGPVYDRVLGEGKTYHGQANIFGVPHFSIYEPIVVRGEVIGILFVGIPRRAAESSDALMSAKSSDEIGTMRAAVTALGKAAKAKEVAEKEAAELRQHAEEERQQRAAEQARAAQQRARAVKDRAQAMAEISTTVKHNAAEAAQADRVANSACSTADSSGQVVAQAIEAMSRIEKASGQIADIVSVIDEIAQQTNLLALNAAVEAARAGEAGRGFGVVAAEVRALAQRCSGAAKDIKTLIGNSSDRVQDGARLVNSAGRSLAEIVESIRKVATIVSGIARASSQQAAGLEQINRALTQLDDMAGAPGENPGDAIAA